MKKLVKKKLCFCGNEKCRNPGGPQCSRATRSRIARLELVYVQKLPSLEMCEAVQKDLDQYNAALSQHIEKARWQDADLAARYVLIQLLTEKLASLTSPEAAEAFARGALPKVDPNHGTAYVRTLGPLEGIFNAIHQNELAGARAHAEPPLREPRRALPLRARKILPEPHAPARTELMIEVCKHCGRRRPDYIHDPTCPKSTERTRWVYCAWIEKLPSSAAPAAPAS